ncbi:MAG: hypothetical protein ACO4AY_06080 [Ilumatobacteraceae bacterium]|jgi:hypothetical protein
MSSGLNVRGLERLIWWLHRDGGGDEFRAGPDEFLDRRGGEFGLGDEELDLLRRRDYRGLIDVGVHPMASLFYSQVNRVPMPLYLENIGASDERVAEFKAVFRRIHGDI